LENSSHYKRKIGGNHKTHHNPDYPSVALIRENPPEEQKQRKLRKRESKEVEDLREVEELDRSQLSE
jgi:hypothetical protein